MRVQEDHDAADDLLIGPAGGDSARADCADTRNFPQSFGGLFDDIEDCRAERLDQLARIDRGRCL
jgi:hypothetical protein